MTIRHVVMWQVNGETPEEKATNAQVIRDALLPLLGRIPEIRALRLHDNLVPESRNADIILVSEFDSLEDLRAYQVHPEHEAAAERIRAVSAQRMVGDWQD